jgi:hypothetical protein
MFSRIRKRFTYTNVAATLALVFAMSGGAYAANRFLITSTKQISPKVLKALKGVRGANGANGANGAPGANGPAGPAGPGGPTGPGGGPGPKGETGERGEKGEKGDPGTTGFTETLPSGKSETGQWGTAQHISEVGEKIILGLSFPIPLATPLNEEHVHYIGEGEGEGEPKENLPTGCAGNVTKPKAELGNLCVFTRIAVNFTSFKHVVIPFAIEDVEAGEHGAGKSGAYLLAELAGSETGKIVADGDWVVTAG